MAKKRKTKKEKELMKKIKLAEIVIVSIILFIGLSIFVNKVIKTMREDLRRLELKEKSEDVEDEISRNISIELYPTQNYGVVAKVTNDNSVPVSVIVDVNFYDEDNNLIDSASAYALQIAPNYFVYEEVLGVPEKYDRYAYFYTCHDTFSKEYILDNVDIKTKEKKDELEITITNNNDRPIRYIKGAIVYYLNDEIVYLGSFYENEIEPGKTAKETSHKPYRFDLSDYVTIPIEYDSFIVHINESVGYD